MNSMCRPFRFLVPAVLVVLAAGSTSLSAQQGPPQRYRPAVTAMSGTYELESTRGGNPQREAELATRDLQPSQRDRVYQSLLSRLQPPATLAIDRNGRTFTISSSSGPRATFDADGRTREEIRPNGRMTTTRAEFIGNRLSVSTSGDRDTDFVVTFEFMNNGSGLFVTRRMDSAQLRRPVTIQSYYRRVANQPRWDVYAPEPEYAPARDPRWAFVPDGMRLDAVLDTSLSTRTSRNDQRFSMTVLGPQEYRYARVYGAVTGVTQYGPGRNAELHIDFDAIESIDGETFDFDGVIESVRTRGGAGLRVGRNRTDATIQQGAVGAALGAIIGAIAGGGRGAAIGAVIGGTSGVILAQDREQYLDLPPGTRVTIIATSLRRRTP